MGLPGPRGVVGREGQEGPPGEDGHPGKDGTKGVPVRVTCLEKDGKFTLKDAHEEHSNVFVILSMGRLVQYVEDPLILVLKSEMRLLFKF